MIITTRSISGREGPKIKQHFSITNSSDVMTVRDKRLQHYYMTKAKNMSNWSEVYDDLDVNFLKDEKNIYLIGGPFLPGSQITRHSKRVGIFPTDSGQLRYVSNGVVLLLSLYALKANREFDIPIHHIAFDPDEMAFTQFHEDYQPNEYHIYHGYEIPKYNVKRLDSLQYHLNKKKSLFSEYKKDIDFVFGYTAIYNDKRISYIDDINNFTKKFDNKKIFLQTKETNNSVPLDEYFSFIQRSKYTYILPAYDTHCFSVYRMIESLHYDCLPLIHPDCNLDDIQNSFDVDMSTLVRNDMFTDDEYYDILNYYKKKFNKFKYNFMPV